VRAHALRLLAAGAPAGEVLPHGGRVRSPIPVRDPNGDTHSWFVPLTHGGRLAGFLQLLPDMTFLRASTFQRTAGSLAGCPAADAWLDETTIAARASTRLRRGERAGRPYLTYDRNPTRLVWAVPVTGTGGRERTVFVAGDDVFEPASDG
jgi:hypothetical protein